jgi:hypoxanthine phosphoribosyltransferase
MDTLIDDVKLVNAYLKRQGASEIRVVASYYKPWSKLVPDYYEKETCYWVVFPWERKETVRKTLEKFRKEGRSVDEAKEKLISSGLDRKLVERFTEEVLEETP